MAKSSSRIASLLVAADPLSHIRKDLVEDHDGPRAGRKVEKSSFILSVQRIRCDAEQVRQLEKNLDHPELQELAKSIREHGLRNYPEVRYREQNDVYEIVTGERRFLAMSRILEWKEIPVRIVDIPQENLLWIQLQENIHRRNLHPMDLANSIQKAVDSGLSLRQISQKLSKSETYVQKAMTIAGKLSPEARKILDHAVQQVTFDSVYAIATLPAAKQRIVAQEVIGKKMTQRQTIAVAKEAKARLPKHKMGRTGRPVAQRSLERKFSTPYGTVTVECKAGAAKNDVLRALQGALQQCKAQR